MPPEDVAALERELLEVEAAYLAARDRGDLDEFRRLQGKRDRIMAVLAPDQLAYMAPAAKADEQNAVRKAQPAFRMVQAELDHAEARLEASVRLQLRTATCPERQRRYAPTRPRASRGARRSTRAGPDDPEPPLTSLEQARAPARPSGDPDLADHYRESAKKAGFAWIGDLADDELNRLRERP
jgi:hypothetical protein